MIVHVRSPEELKAHLDRFKKIFPQGVAIAEYQFVQTVLNDSDPNVPVDLGYLRASRYTNDPVISTGEISTEFGYWANYAAAVHNIPEPPLKSEGGRSAHHEHGNAFFLKNSVDEHKGEFQKELVLRVEEMLGGEL